MQYFLFLFFQIKIEGDLHGHLVKNSLSKDAFRIRSGI